MMSGQVIGILVGVFAVASAGTSHAAGIDYPLKIGTVWTYHLHQENAPGVHFDSSDSAAAAHGNRIEATVVSRVAGRERINGDEYARVESTHDGRPYITEWYRATADGLYLGKTIQGGSGEETVLIPPQRVLNHTLQRGESWAWQASNAPVVTETHVRSSEHMTLPAGSFDATVIETDARAGQPPQQVSVRMRRWFVPGTGFVKFETQSSLAGRQLTRVVLTLERFEPAR